MHLFLVADKHAERAAFISYRHRGSFWEQNELPRSLLGAVVDQHGCDGGPAHTVDHPATLAGFGPDADLVAAGGDRPYILGDYVKSFVRGNKDFKPTKMNYRTVVQAWIDTDDLEKGTKVMERLALLHQKYKVQSGPDLKTLEMLLLAWDQSRHDKKHVFIPLLQQRIHETLRLTLHFRRQPAMDCFLAGRAVARSSLLNFASFVIALKD